MHLFTTLSVGSRCSWVANALETVSRAETENIDCPWASYFTLSSFRLRGKVVMCGLDVGGLQGRPGGRSCFLPHARTLRYA